MTKPFGEDKTPDRLVFIPGDELEQRPQRVSDKPIRPAPRPIDDGTPTRWSPDVKEKKHLVSNEAKKLLSRLGMLLVVVGSLVGLYYLIDWVLAFYDINLF